MSGSCTSPPLPHLLVGHWTPTDSITNYLVCNSWGCWSNQWINKLNPIDSCGRSHVFRVQSCNTGFLARAKNHAIPRGKAEPARQIQSTVQNRLDWKLKRKEGS